MADSVKPSQSLDDINLYSRYQNRLKCFIDSSTTKLLQKNRIGLEKETLRVNPHGGIAQTPHPSILGSALTNPYITTDYSEALLELITPPMSSGSEALDFLCKVQQYVYSHLNDEILWATSMPCVVAGETSIPIAEFGDSNAGIMKTVYRRGLGHRYGHTMQVIAGVHFNFSLAEDFWPVYQQQEGNTQPLQDFISAEYFAMLRNLQRMGWLIPYLFGASPAVCKSFLSEQETSLKEFDENTYYEPFATSLRMGDIGYQNNKEAETGIKANYDSVSEYIASLKHAIETPCSEYTELGVKVDGEYQQLNDSILQIENEYYSTVRPKQPPQTFEKPIMALQRAGVQYVELRSLDVNAFEPLGICDGQSRFIEAFMLFCLLHDSPSINTEQRLAIDKNELDTAHRGREPDFELNRDGEIVKLKEWATEVLTAMEAICDCLDTGQEDSPYRDALAVQLKAVENPDLTPSARMLREMRDKNESFYHFAKRMSQSHYAYFRSLDSCTENNILLQSVADDSLQRQREIEASDEISFDEYLKRYNAQ